ncbi:MAG: ABC transporter ATP-binding protein [Actinobacteria bacterium RBG_16_64_13]|nr:MAG: ABC transporter ATP-binding protein [Actinobacteria bacterium RBG_16_64_13]
MRRSVLELHGVRAGYGRIEVLHGLDLTVAEGEIVTIIGANGAGKSTLLRAISGVVRISGGSISFGGERIDTLGVETIVKRRLVQIPEGRQLFGPLTVEENLQLGAYSQRRRGSSMTARLERVFALFPRLEERLGQQAGTLSGGEQQMLAVARALMAEPRLLLLDEPSMGLAPIVVRDIFTSLRSLNEEGLTMVLVEQDARIALSLAHRGLVMERGRIVLADAAQALLDNPEVRAIYFGRRSARHRSGMENT